MTAITVVNIFFDFMKWIPPDLLSLVFRRTAAAPAVLPAHTASPRSVAVETHTPARKILPRTVRAAVDTAIPPPRGSAASGGLSPQKRRRGHSDLAVPSDAVLSDILPASVALIGSDAFSAPGTSAAAVFTSAELAAAAPSESEAVPTFAAALSVFASAAGVSGSQWSNESSWSSPALCLASA